MIKCLECGIETNRLQWTHFKFNCTGKFSNSKEYKLAYPNAVLVSAEVAAKTALTKEKLITKYGIDEGIIRWDQYRAKQADSNSFEYKHKKYGWTIDQFNDYNSSRSQTLEKMIKRHGENLGTKKWLAYCERQAYTNSKIYFVEKYGVEEGNAKFLQLNAEKGSSSNPHTLSTRLGISIDEAVTLILNRSVRPGNIWGSNIEQEFTTMLIDTYGSLEYTTFTRPYGRWSTLLGTYVIYDIKHKDCIIEFNGDYWHANPALYKNDAIIRGRTALEIQEHDRKKLKTATDLGFRTYTVWEAEFKLDKQQTINRVIAWMQSGQK
jgi:hypothetical protein